MMTPSEIKNELAKIKRRAVVSKEGARRDKQQLYIMVLLEISKGCLDPRSLAIAVLEKD